MQYNLDENGYIANYAIIGEVANGVEFTGEIPDGFRSCPRAYKVVGGALVLDEARAEELARQFNEPTIEERVTELETAFSALIRGETE